MRRLVIFMTGQFRSFWRAYSNMMEKIVMHAEKSGYRVILCIGLDASMKTRGVSWNGEEERQEMTEMIRRDWLEAKKDRGFMMEWIDKTHEDFRTAEKSLTWFRDKGSLQPYWMDYLLHRSGSCIEYAQFNALMERCVQELAPFHADDLLLRTRTDILLRHDLKLDCALEFPSNHIQDLFPNAPETVDWKRNGEREASILQESTTDETKWVATLRKNLIYLMPLIHAPIICEVARYYGNWDTPQENKYWFNAESQFRGCLRSQGFNVLEYSQDVDECHDEHEFSESAHRLPIYAIMRAI